jgi:hypothetical protein
LQEQSPEFKPPFCQKKKSKNFLKIRCQHFSSESVSHILVFGGQSKVAALENIGHD